MESAARFSSNSRIELVNGRIADVQRGVYLAPGTRMIITGGVIEALPAAHESVPLDQRIARGERAVIPVLFNTHSHIQMN